MLDCYKNVSFVNAQAVQELVKGVVNLFPYGHSCDEAGAFFEELGRHPELHLDVRVVRRSERCRTDTGLPERHSTESAPRGAPACFECRQPT